MSTNHKIYYILLATSALLSWIRVAHDRRLLVFFWLLVLNLFEELLFEYLEYRTGNKYFIIYHLYVPLYYGLFAWYFSLNIPNKKFRKYLVASIIAFSIFSLAYSGFYDKFKQFPGIQINSIGILLIVCSLLTMFSLDATNDTPLINRPVFWISISTLIFYSGIFFVNGAYAYLLASHSELAERLNEQINNNLNFLYYSLTITGMLCSRPIRTST